MKHRFCIVCLSACVDTPPLYEPTVEQDRVNITMLGETPRAEVDLLIVVDDTAAMLPYREHIATLPAHLAARLESYTRRWIDLRVAVTSNDGSLRRMAGTPEPWLAVAYDFDYSRRSNYAGALGDALATLMDVGAASSTSQPLEAARRALETGSELVRDRAGLMILTVTASDDASPLPVADYVQWMRAAIGTTWRREVLNSGLYAQPAARLDEYYKTVPSPIVTSIDGDDFEAAIPWVPANGWSGPMPCMTIDDLDPSTPVFDYECQMMASIDDHWRGVPECTPAERVESSEALHGAQPRQPCWWLKQDTQACFYSGYQLALTGYTDGSHPALRLDCRSR